MAINIRIRDGLCPDPSTGDGGATEGDIRGAISDIIDTVGVKDLAGGHCLVTENSPAAMSVLVAPGVVYIPNANYDELDSNTVKFWEAIITVSTTVVITANTSGSTRIDLICAKMDTTIIPDEHASNIATLVVVQGTPGAGAPTLPDNHAKLAEVEVADDAVTIVTADITDSRVQAKINSDYLLKATGDTVNTGTDDTTIVTPKAIADSTIAKSPASATENAAGTDNAKFLTALANVPAFNNSLARQAIINGNFDVWQRGTSFGTPPGNYTADRWKAYNDATNQATTITRQDGTGVYGSVYSLRYQRTAGQTGTNIEYLTSSLESINCKKFRNKKLTLSFWAKCGANYSPTSSILTAQIMTGTGTDEDVLAGYTGTAAVANENKTLTTSWQKFTLTTTNVLADTVNEFAVRFLSTPVGTAGANDWFEVTQVQLCAGDVALPFMPKSFEEELRTCQRYFEKSYNYATVAGTNTETGIVSLNVASTLGLNMTIPYKVNKRISTTPTIYSRTGASGNWYDVTAAANVAIGGTVPSDNNFLLYGNQTADHQVQFHYTAEAEL